MIHNTVTSLSELHTSFCTIYIVVLGNHSDKIPQEEITGSMVNNVYLWSLLWVHIVCNIELESVSAAVRAGINLKKVLFLIGKDMLLILILSDTLIRVLRLRLFFTKHKESIK